MTLVFWGGMAAGAPAGGDPLTGQEFLAMYMRRQPQYLDHNAIPHKEHQHEFTDIGNAGLEEEEREGVTENDDVQSTTALEEESTTTEEPTTLIETTRIERSTTESDWDEEHPSQVVSVRVSSSVVRKRPEPQEEKAISVSYRVEAKVADSYPSASQTQEKYVKNGSDYARAEALTYHRIDLGTDPQNTPVSYETSVSSASSGSSVRFYREPPSYQYSTQVSARQQRNYHIPENDGVFGQRERPRQKQDNPSYPKRDEDYQKQQEQIFPKQEQIFQKTQSQVFPKQEPLFQKSDREIFPKQDQSFTEPRITEPSVFPKPEQIFQKTDQQIFQKQNIFSTSERQLYPKQEQLYHKPEPSIYSKQEEIYEKQDRQYSKPEDIYSKLEQTYNKQEEIFRKQEQIYNKQEEPYVKQEQVFGKSEQVFNKPEQVYEKSEQIYGKSEQVYGKPEEVYGKPEQVYGKPEEVYGKPEENYEKPEQVYSKAEYVKQERNYGKVSTEGAYPKPEQIYGEPERIYGEPEQNYEVDEAVSVATQGRTHGVQEDSKDKHKFGYVVEGRNFRKYRVEEKTADGFIVGEYGVVSHDDGSLRGVRYTADSNINPRLIYDALVKFLSLK